MSPRSKTPAVLALVGCALGLWFASYSTLDYAQHLDRALHDLHCSIIPGAAASAEAESCRAAMYSSYGAVFRESLWGGIPVSLFALGAYSFLAAFAAYLLAAGAGASGKAVGFFAAVSTTPLLVSIVMFAIALTELGELCKTCVGLYLASIVLAAGGLLGLRTLRPPAFSDAPERPPASGLLPLVWLGVLGGVTLVPALVYASSVPDHRPYLTRCGQLESLEDKTGALLRFRSAESVQPALLVEDPLCETCKAFHQRLTREGLMRRLDTTLVLFPLDSTCNWMLDRPLHAGACTVAKTILCGGANAPKVLEWAYEEQAYLVRAGKQGEGVLRAVINNRWGPSMLSCIDARDTETQLNRNLHFAAENGIPVSTPQIYLGKQRVCDEDTDIGLRFTLAQLAPEVVR